MTEIILDFGFWILDFGASAIQNPKPKIQNWLVLAACGVLLVALVGCDTGGLGSGNRVKLVITPVDTPTATALAAPTAAPTTYTVRPGDTLSGIAALFGVTVDDIVRVNDITDPNVLSEGQVLTIPGRSPATPTGAPEGSPGAEASSTPGTPVPQASPTLPPPDVTPPLGPTEALPAPP
jgi:LysM repeat protein